MTVPCRLLLPPALLLAALGCNRTVTGQADVLEFEDVSPSINRPLGGTFGLGRPVAVGSSIDLVVRPKGASTDDPPLDAKATSADPSVFEVVDEGVRLTLEALATGSADIDVQTDEGDDAVLLQAKEADGMALTPRLPGAILNDYLLAAYPGGIATLPGARVGIAGQPQSGDEALAGYGLVELSVTVGAADLTPFDDDADAFWVRPTTPGSTLVAGTLGDPFAFVALDGTTAPQLRFHGGEEDAPTELDALDQQPVFWLTLTDGDGRLVLPPETAEVATTVVDGPEDLLNGLECNVESGFCVMSGTAGTTGRVRFELASISREVVVTF